MLLGDLRAWGGFMDRDCALPFGARVRANGTDRGLRKYAARLRYRRIVASIDELLILPTGCFFGTIRNKRIEKLTRKYHILNILETITYFYIKYKAITYNIFFYNIAAASVGQKNGLKMEVGSFAEKR